jgi:RNA polymerase sigma-70 factor, ECF subfamily
MCPAKLKTNISSLQKGERSAFEEIYNDFFGVIYHLSFQYLKDEKISEEIVHDSFMKLWEIRETLNEHFNIRNFLYTITKNNCLNYLRNQKTALMHQENIKYLEMQFNYEALDKLGSYIEFEELREKIDRAVASLPEDLRETFLLSRFDELPYKGIAEKQSISVKTVEARMTKSLKILRHELREYLAIICVISNLFS